MDKSEISFFLTKLISQFGIYHSALLLESLRRALDDCENGRISYLEMRRQISDILKCTWW